MVNSKKREITPTSRDYTINLHKNCHGVQFKKKAKKAVRFVKDFGRKNMLTDDVRIDVKLNSFIWNKGIRNIPRRVRVRFSRKKDENDETGKKFFTLAEHIPVDCFKGLMTEVSK